MSFPLRRRAYHEAGHAVAAFLLRRRFAKVSIVQRGGHGGTGGQTFLYDRSWKMLTRTRQAIQREIIVYLAGPVAEHYVTWESSPSSHPSIELRGAGGDLPQIIQLSRKVFRSEAKRQAYVRSLVWRTVSLLIVHQSAVHALAEELLEHRELRERRTRAVIREAIRRRRLQEGKLHGPQSQRDARAIIRDALAHVDYLDGYGAARPMACGRRTGNPPVGSSS